MSEPTNSAEQLEASYLRNETAFTCDWPIVETRQACGKEANRIVGGHDTDWFYCDDHYEQFLVTTYRHRP